MESAHSRTKNGLRARTTGSECDRYDSYLYRKSDTALVVLGTRIAYQKSSMYLGDDTSEGPGVLLGIATHESLVLA